MSNKIPVVPILTILLASMIFISSQSTIAFGQSSPTGVIAFESDRDGNREIYVMNTDGTSQTRLTTNTAMDVFSSWSPDGTKIAFASNRDGNAEIYVMNADGTGQTRITTNPANDVYPSWSPDGKKIVFVSQRDGENREIYVMNADGTAQTRLTNNPASDVNPSWSPDGKKIVFESDRDGNDQIYVMNADGTSQTNISNNLTNDVSPSWSPDGTKIVFVSTRDGNNEIYVMNADGTGQTRITTNPAQDVYSSWSPDGTKIVFVSDRDGNNEIYVMNADGSSQKNISNNPAFEVDPVWQPIPTEPQPQPVPVPEIEEKITICHIPPDNPNNPQTISISKNSWSTHMAHGDTIGECQEKPIPVPEKNGVWGKITQLYQKRYPYYDQLHIDVASSLIRDKLCEKTFGEDGKLYYDPCFATDLNGKTTGIGAGLLNKIHYQKLRVELYTDNYSQLLDTQYFIWKGFSGEPSPQPEQSLQPEPNTSFNSCSELATRSLIGDKQIVVFTDKSSYREGDTVVISGEVKDLLPIDWGQYIPIRETYNQIVSMQVFAPNGNLVTIEQIDVGEDHKFCREISAGGALWNLKGTYSVIVLYGKESLTASTTFKFPDDLNSLNLPAVSQPQPESVDKKITICHIPPGNSANAHTLSISQNAWSAHQAHGDTIGECQQKSIQEVFGDGNTKEQNKPKTIGSLTKQNQQSKSLWSDKSTYVDGSIIHIEGKTKDIQPNSMVNVRVYSPSKYNIADERLLVSNDGKFEIDFDTSDKLWFENGEYVIKVEDQRHNEQNQIRVTVDEPHGEFTASAQEAPVATAEKPSKDNYKLSDLIEENKKLREELERQGSEIVNLNKQVDYLGGILQGLRGIFSWAFP